MTGRACQGGGTPPMISIGARQPSEGYIEIKNAGRKFDDIQVDGNRVIS
jgi:hypothetical protein